LAPQRVKIESKIFCSLKLFGLAKPKADLTASGLQWLHTKVEFGQGVVAVVGGREVTRIKFVAASIAATFRFTPEHNRNYGKIIW
jgi:hypothetical protein